MSKNLLGFCLWGGGNGTEETFNVKMGRENKETVWKQTQETFNLKVLHLSWRDTWTSWGNTCVRSGCVGALRGECFVLGCTYVHSWCTRKKPSCLSSCGWMLWRTLVYSSVCVCVCFNQCVVYMFRTSRRCRAYFCILELFANSSSVSANKCLFREGYFSMFLIMTKKTKKLWHSQVYLVNW